jgi:Bacterial capsule synthesis protein PGA_cap
VRVLALAVRAGAVVVAIGFLFSLLVHGPPSAVSARAQAAPVAKPAPTPKVPAAAKPVRKPVPAGVVSIAAVGDIVMGSTPNLPPEGGRTFFDAVETDLAADVVVGNLEGTLSTGGSAKCGAGSSNCFAFKTPPSYAGWLQRAGFTMMNLANNHARDFGPAGEQQTVAALDGVGLLHTGRPGEIAYQQVGAIRVAFVGFAPYPWAQSLTKIGAARKLVHKAAAHADVVIVTMHAGAEGADRMHVRPGTETFLGENRGNAVAFSHAVVEAGADLVLGSGPHVLRGMEWYRGRLIAYSLGNFAGYGVFALGGRLSLSAILRVTLRGDGSFDSGVLVPTRLVGAGMPALDPAESAHGLVRDLSKADFGSRGVTVSPGGDLGR